MKHTHYLILSLVFLALGTGCAPVHDADTRADEGDGSRRTVFLPNGEPARRMNYYGGLLQPETASARTGNLFGVIAYGSAGPRLVTSRNHLNEWSSLPQPETIGFPRTGSPVFFPVGTALQTRAAVYHLAACGPMLLETRADEHGVTTIYVSGGVTPAGTTLRPFGNDYRGPASVACHIDWYDGFATVAAAAGRGALPAVNWFRIHLGVGTVELIRRQIVYADTFRGGVQIALGDLGGDGEPELAVAPEGAGEMAVKIYRSETSYTEATVKRLPVFAGTSPGPGLRLAIGSFGGDPLVPMLAVALGAGVKPAVDVFVPRQSSTDWSLSTVFAGQRPLLFGAEFRGGIANLSIVPAGVFGLEKLLACPGHGGREVCNVFDVGY